MSAEIPASEINSTQPDDRSDASRAVEFGSGDSMGDGWGIPFGGGGRHGWWRVFEVFPPKRGVARTGTGKYVNAAEGAAWEAALGEIADGLSSAGFTPEDLYVLSLTLQHLDDDQWARVDKRLFAGEGVHTRDGWKLWPIPEKWAEWPALVRSQGMLPHEATEIVLGGVWRGRGWY